MSREPRSWPRCGSGSSDVSVETLRRGLARAENPSGVIRGRTVPRPSGRLVALQAERSSAMASSSSSSAPTVNGNAMALIASPLSALPPPPPRPAPMDREKALDLRRAHKLIKFVGGEADRPSEDWCCAICLHPSWHKTRLSRMPRCTHTLCAQNMHQIGNMFQSQSMNTVDRVSCASAAIQHAWTNGSSARATAHTAGNLFESIYAAGEGKIDQYEAEHLRARAAYFQALFNTRDSASARSRASRAIAGSA